MKIKSLILLVFLLSAHGKAEVLTITNHGFVIKNQLAVTKDAKTAWTGLVEHVNQWWPKDHTWWGDKGTLSIDPRAGGCFCEISDQKSAEHMRVSFVEPNKLLRMTGGLGPLQGMGMYGALDWQIIEDKGLRYISLSYRVSGINAEGFEQLAPIVDKVMGLQLQALVDFVNTDKNKE